MATNVGLSQIRGEYSRSLASLSDEVDALNQLKEDQEGFLKSAKKINTCITSLIDLGRKEKSFVEKEVQVLEGQVEQSSKELAGLGPELVKLREAATKIKALEKGLQDLQKSAEKGLDAFKKKYQQLGAFRENSKAIARDDIVDRRFVLSSLRREFPEVEKKIQELDRKEKETTTRKKYLEKRILSHMQVLAKEQEIILNLDLCKTRKIFLIGDLERGSDKIEMDRLEKEDISSIVETVDKIKKLVAEKKTLISEGENLIGSKKEVVTPTPGVVVLSSSDPYSKYGRMMFGPTEWRSFFGVQTEPADPSSIFPVLESKCPFWGLKDKDFPKVMDTHLLMFIPEKVCGKPFTLASLNEMLRRRMQYAIANDLERNLPQHYHHPVGQSYWVLLTKDIIPGSRMRDTRESPMAFGNASYRTPKAIEVAASILLHYAKTKEKLYPEHIEGLPKKFEVGRTFTRCEETNTPLLFMTNPLFVGSFGADGIHIADGFSDCGIAGITGQDHGLAGVRRFGYDPQKPTSQPVNTSECVIC